MSKTTLAIITIVWLFFGMMLITRVYGGGPNIGEKTSFLEILCVAALLGTGIGVDLYISPYITNPIYPPIPFPDKLFHWVITLLAGAIGLRIFFRIRPIIRKILTFVMGCALGYFVMLRLYATFGIASPFRKNSFWPRS